MITFSVLPFQGLSGIIKCIHCILQLKPLGDEAHECTVFFLDQVLQILIDLKNLSKGYCVLMEEGLVIHFIFGAESVGRHGHDFDKEHLMAVGQGLDAFFIGYEVAVEER